MKSTNNKHSTIINCSESILNDNVIDSADCLKYTDTLYKNTLIKESKSDLRKRILFFAWPCIIELFLLSMTSVFNLIMVGHLGAYAISAIGIITQPYFICIGVFQAFNIGATALISRFIGSNDKKNIKLVIVQTLHFSFISGIFLCIIGYSFSHFIVTSMGAKKDTVYYADLFMKYISIGMIFQSIPIAVSSLLRGAGETKAPMCYNIISNIIHVLLGFVLVYGFLFFPSLGFRGTAIASLAAKVVAFTLSALYLFSGKSSISISFKELFHIDTKILKRILNIGYAAACEQIVLRFGLLIFTKIVADLGTKTLAAHQICINMISLSFNIGCAFGITATSFVGRNLGEKRPADAESSSYEIRKIGFLISVFMSIIIFLANKQIINLFTSDKSVISICSNIFIIIVFLIPIQNSQLIITGGLRGAGDTKWPLLTSICGILIVRLILSVILVKYFKLGLNGAWIALAIDQGVRSLLIYLRFRNGKWKSIIV